MVLFFYGPNSYASRQKVAELIARYQAADATGFGLERFEAASGGGADMAERMVAAMTSLPFLGGNRLIIIEDLLSNKELAEAVLSHLNRVPDSTVVVIYETEPDERTKAFKTLKTSVKTLKFGLLTPSKLNDWVQKTATDLDGSIDTPTANQLIERVGPDQWHLSNELVKLISFEPTITSKTITELVEPTFRQSIFDLVDSLGSGHTEQALGLYQGLRATKQQPLYILSMIGWAIRNLVIAKAGAGQSPGAIAADFKLSPYVVGKAMRVAANLTLNQLKTCVAIVMDVDRKLKSTSLDADLAIEQLLIDLSQALKAKTRVKTAT